MTTLRMHPGLRVLRMGNGVIRKQAEPGEHYLATIEAVRNEAKMLETMSGSGFTPQLYHLGPDFIDQEDLGDTEPVTNGLIFIRNCTRVLIGLRNKEVFHGDLTNINLVIRNNWPWVVDWQESHNIFSGFEPKRAESDSFIFWRTVQGLVPSRPVQRWMVVLEALEATEGTMPILRGKRLLDIGCNEGDTSGMAASELMTVDGIDVALPVIYNARKMWEMDRPQVRFHIADAANWKDFRYDIVLFFSTWAYVLIQHGEKMAHELLDRIVSHCGVLFFETQINGDGCGPPSLDSHHSVYQMLQKFGQVRELSMLPVAGRDACRSIWEVKRE